MYIRRRAAHRVLWVLAWLGLVLAVSSCSSGGGEDAAPAPNPSTPQSPSIPENGAISTDPETGEAIFESDEVEIQPGLLFSQRVALTAANPDDETTGYKAVSILKFTNTTDQTISTKFIAQIPKTLAQDVSALKYKILASAPDDLTLSELLDDPAPVVGIDQFVSQHSVEVIERDPIIAIPVLIAGGVLVNAAAYVFFDRPDLVGLTPRSTPDDLKDFSVEQIKAWIDDRLLAVHCGAVRDSAKNNKIPARLLANIVLNEIADYGWEDTLQEIVYTGQDRSHGWVQLQPSRIINHGLIDIGSRDSIRIPGVDLAEEDMIYQVPGQPSEGFITLRKNVNEEIWHRLSTPAAGIELAAREIAFLLAKLKKGSPALNNPWARAFLVNPSTGIDLEDIYGNLRITGSPATPQERQAALERTLAVLVAAGYNGSGAIFDVTTDEGIYTAQELLEKAKLGEEGLRSHGIPWETLGDIDDKDAATGNFKYPFRDPRLHAQNAGLLLPQALRQADCLNEGTFSADVSIPGYSSSFNPVYTAAFQSLWINRESAIHITAAGGAGEELDYEYFSIMLNPNIVSGPGTYPVSSDASTSGALILYGHPDIRHAPIGEDSDGLTAPLSAFSGTVTIAEFGQNVGERVGGSFSAQIFGAQITGMDSDGTITTTTHTGTVSGSFSMPIVPASAP